MKKMGERRGTKALETWCRRLTEGYPDVKIENMTTSWRDGLAFCALIHHFRPDLIDFSSLNKDDIYYNCSLAFSVAERSLGIPALLDAEDMVEFPVPDRLSILTYLSQFYQVFGGSSGSPTRIVAKRPAVSTDSCLSPPSTSPPTKMAARSSNIPSRSSNIPSIQGLGRREPCGKCSMPVFLAERLHVGSKMYHRTCFRCARCNNQLSLANCYETETDGVYCCETCPDEEDEIKPPQIDLTDPNRSLSDEQKQQGLQKFDDDEYSRSFEMLLEDSKITKSRREMVNTMLQDDTDDTDQETNQNQPLPKPRSFTKSLEINLTSPDESNLDPDSGVELRKPFRVDSPSLSETKPPDRISLTISVNSVKKSDDVNKLDQPDTASDVFNTNVTKDNSRQSLVQNRRLLFETQVPSKSVSKPTSPKSFDSKLTNHSGLDSKPTNTSSPKSLDSKFSNNSVLDSKFANNSSPKSLDSKFANTSSPKSLDSKFGNNKSLDSKFGSKSSSKLSDSGKSTPKYSPNLAKYFGIDPDRSPSPPKKLQPSKLPRNEEEPNVSSTDGSRPKSVENLRKTFDSFAGNERKTDENAEKTDKNSPDFRKKYFEEPGKKKEEVGRIRSSEFEGFSRDVASRRENGSSNEDNLKITDPEDVKVEMMDSKEDVMSVIAKEAKIREEELQKMASGDGEVKIMGYKEGELQKMDYKEEEPQKIASRDGEVKIMASKEDGLQKLAYKEEELQKMASRDGEVKIMGYKEGELQKMAFKEEEPQKMASRDGEVKIMGYKEEELRKMASRDGEVKIMGYKEGQLQKMASEGDKIQKLASKEEEVQKMASEGDKVQKLATKEEELQKMASEKEKLGIMASEKEKLGIMASKEEEVQKMASEKEKLEIMASKEEDVQKMASEKEKLGIMASEKEELQVKASKKEEVQIKASENEELLVMASKEGDLKTKTSIEGEDVSKETGNVSKDEEMVFEKEEEVTASKEAEDKSMSNTHESVKDSKDLGMMEDDSKITTPQEDESKGMNSKSKNPFSEEEIEITSEKSRSIKNLEPIDGNLHSSTTSSKVSKQFVEQHPSHPTSVSENSSFQSDQPIVESPAMNRPPIVPRKVSSNSTISDLKDGSEISFKEDYPTELNPFGDESEDEESFSKSASLKLIRPSVEDFGVVRREKPPKPAMRNEGNKKVLEAPKINLNPFWSDGEEPSDDDEAGKPIPLPRNSVKTLGTPEPKPRRTGAAHEKYDSNSSLSTSSHTSSLGRRKKKPAPKPPVQSPTTDSLSPNKSLSTSSSPRTYRKNRRAPLPPTSTPIKTDTTTLELEKIDKDERNRNRQSQSITSSVSESESLTSPVVPDKSMYGKWKRRKGPAPSRPVPQRRQIKPLPLQQLKHELDLIEQQQQGLEKQGVKLEQLIREKCEGPEMSEDSSLTPEVEELVLELFELVNEKNELFRRQAELMYLRRQQRLEEEHADLEYQIRCLMNQPELNKTDSDKAREEELITRLLQVVERRNEIVECLEMDRVREAEEDLSINTRLNLIQCKRDEENFLKTISESPVKLSKKEKKKMKKEKKLKEKGKNADVDKDIDETEVVSVKDKKKRKWF